MGLDLTTEEVNSIRKVLHEFHKTRMIEKFSIDMMDLSNLLDVCLLATGQKRRYKR